MYSNAEGSSGDLNYISQVIFIFLYRPTIAVIIFVTN